MMKRGQEAPVSFLDPGGGGEKEMDSGRDVQSSNDEQERPCGEGRKRRGTQNHICDKI